MNIPFNLNSSNNSSNKRIKKNKVEIENKISSIDSAITLINRILEDKVIIYLENNEPMNDTAVQNIRNRVRRLDDEITTYVIDYINKKEDFSDKTTDKSKLDISVSYRDFFENLITELETYRSNLQEKKDRLEQIEYDKKRLGEDFNENDYDIPEYNDELKRTLNEIQEKNKESESSNNINDSMMTVNEFILFIIIEFKNRNDIDYNYENYQMYKNIYPEKTQIIQQNINNDNLTYLCKDVECLPPLTTSQIKSLNMIKKMVNDGNIRKIDKYVEEIIQ